MTVRKESSSQWQRCTTQRQMYTDCTYSERKEEAVVFNYIICWILRVLLLALSYDLLEDRRIDDVIIGHFLSLYYIK